jgi:hypothetical protein
MMPKEIISTIVCETCGIRIDDVSPRLCHDCYLIETGSERYLQSPKGRAFIADMLEKVEKARKYTKHYVVKVIHTDGVTEGEMCEYIQAAVKKYTGKYWPNKYGVLEKETSLLSPENIPTLLQTLPSEVLGAILDEVSPPVGTTRYLSEMHGKDMHVKEHHPPEKKTPGLAVTGPVPIKCGVCDWIASSDGDDDLCGHPD